MILNKIPNIAPSFYIDRTHVIYKVRNGIRTIRNNEVVISVNRIKFHHVKQVIIYNGLFFRGFLTKLGPLL